MAGVEAVIVPLVDQLAVLTSIAMPCALLGRSRASHYRGRKESERRAGLPFGPEPRHESPPRPTPPNALSNAERDRVLGVLTEPRFADKAVAQTWAVLLDERGPRLACICPVLRPIKVQFTRVAHGES